MTERTLLKQTRAEFEDDAISITSSQSEQYSSDQEFLVERILAEKKGADGKMYFLVFWANYPEEKSTWEPKKNIQDPEILQIWKERKDQEYKGLKPTFNIARFDARHQKLAQAKADRHRRRKIKRKRLGIPVSPDLEARRHTDDSDSTEAVESDGAPEDDPGIKMKSKAPQRGEKPSKLPPIQPDSSDDETSPARIRTSIRRDEHESDGAGTSDDSLIGDLKKKPAKKKAKKKALQAMREKRATQGPSKVPTAQDKPAQKKAPGKSAGTRRQSSSSFELPLAEVAEQLRQSEQRSESTDTAISKHFTSTSKASPKPLPKTISSATAASSTRGRSVGRGSSAVGRGRRATRGGSSLVPRNVFSSRAPPKKRPTLIDNAADASKEPKHFTNMRLRRKAQLAGRERADAAPDISALGGLFAPSDPSTFQSLKPVSLRKPALPAPNQEEPELGGHMDIDGLFVSQSSPTNAAGVDAWDPTPDINPAPQHNSPPQTVALSRPQWQDRHGYNAICHFWHMKGSCNKGYQCSYMHTDDDHLPIAPPPPSHRSLYSPPDHTPAKEHNPPVSTSDHQYSPPVSASVPDYNPPAPALPSSRPPWNRPEKWPDHLRAVCYFWHTRGTCTKGDNCGYFHSYEGNLPIAPAPGQRNETCTFWAAGYCEKPADKCKFLHGYPQPPDATSERPEFIEQPGPLAPFPIIRDGAANVPAGPRKSVSFAIDEPRVYSNKPESYNPPKHVPSQSSSMEPFRDPKYNKTCRFWKKGICDSGSQCSYWHSYDGSDKQIQPVNEDLGRNIGESLMGGLPADEHIDSACPADFLDTAGGSDFFHSDRLSRLQTADIRLSLQTEGTSRNLHSESIDLSPHKRNQVQTLAQPHTRLQTEPDINITLSPVADKAETAAPKLKRAKISMDNYCRKKAIESPGDRVKEVAFGKDETKFVLVDFGDLNQAKQQPWGESFAALTKLHFTRICLAQDFKTQPDSLLHQTLWQGSLGPEPTDDEALQTMNKAWEHLRLSSAGFVSACADFIILMYPAIEEWKFIEGNASFSSDMRLRYLVFQSNLDFNSPLDAGLTVDTADSRKNLVETIHGLDFKLFVPKIKKGQTYHFYLLFPSTANKTADFVANSLRASSNQVKIYSSQTEGAWDFFVKDPSVDIGSVLIHESVVVSISELPSLRALFGSSKAITFWYIADGTAEYPMYGPPDGSSPGQITATRLLPHGHAFFLTPSFLIADPERAFVVIRWFIKEKLRKSTPGTWKLVCAYNIRGYLLDLAIEKAAEKDELEVEYQGNPLKDAIIEERGLSYTMCKLRFQMHELVTELLSQQITENYSDYDSDMPDQSVSPIIYASEFIDADDEPALVTWFAGWAMCKLDQFRKFTVIGSGPKYEKRAVRRKEVVSQAPSHKLDERLEPGSSKSKERVNHEFSTRDESSNSGLIRPNRRLRNQPAISSAEPSNIASTLVKSPNRRASIAESSIGIGKVRDLAIAAKLSASAPATPLFGLKAQEKNPFDPKVLSSLSESTTTNTLFQKPQLPRRESVGSLSDNSITRFQASVVGTLGGYAVTIPQPSSQTSPLVDSDTEMSIESTHVRNPESATTKHGIDPQVSPETLQFIMMTGSNLETAKYFLAKSDDDLQLAVKLYEAQAGPISQLDGVDDSMDIDEQVTKAIELYGNKTNADVRSPPFNNSSIFSPPQFDGPTDDRPGSSGATSTSSNRSGIQTDGNGRRVVPSPLRPSGTVRPEVAIKPDYVPSEDREVYQNPHRRVIQGEVSNSDSRNVSHQGSPAPKPSEEKDAERMEVDSPVVEELASRDDEASMEKPKIVMKEIKYEATTTWYARWYKEGKGWEHIYVDSWEKAFKYLGIK